MSKNLEREYRVFANSEVPNLWSRIEAGLDEKPTSDSLVSKSDTDAEKIGQNMTDLHKKWHPKKSSFKVWTGLAAACVCAALIIPAMTSTLWRGGRSSGSSDNMAPPQPMEVYDIAEEVDENGVYIDGAAGGAEEVAYEDSVAEAAEVTADDSGNFNGSTAAENVYIDSDTNIYSNNDSELSAATDGAVHVDSNAEVDKNSGVDLNTGVETASPAEVTEGEKDAYQFAATVEILDTDVRMSSGILYMAKVITSDNPIVQADSEIRIFSPAASPEGVAVFENAQVYELILQKKVVDDSEQEEIYVLVRR